MENKIICIDIGGSSVKSGLLDVRHKTAKILNTLTTELPDRTFSSVKTAVLRSISAQVEHFELEEFHVGVSTSGSVDKNEIVVSAGHFSDYVNVNWQEILEPTTGSKAIVAVANDGRAAALGEFFGVGGEKERSHVHLVVGTGVGGGIIQEGKLLLGESGQAGYIGHLKLTQEKTIVCSCKQQGCLETLSSAPAIVEHYICEHSRTASEMLSNVSFQDVFDAACNQNDAALKAFSKAGYFLGVGIGNTLNILNSSSVSIGGGVIVAALQLEKQIGSTFFFDEIDRGFKYASHRRVYSSAKISPALFGNDSGMIGAGVLCISKLDLASNS